MFGPLTHFANRLRTGRGLKVSPERAACRPSRADKAVLLRDADFVVFDTELTGLNPKKDSVVSIGAIRMRGDRIRLGETFYGLADPRTALTAESVVVHGITPAEAAASPGIEALLPGFTAFAGGAVLAGHVVSIDIRFLNREIKRVYGETLPNPAVDTCKLFQWVRKKQEDACAFHGGTPERNDLFSLAKRYRIPVQQAHNALGDAFVTAQLLQRLLHELAEQGVATVEELLRIGSP